MTHATQEQRIHDILDELEERLHNALMEFVLAYAACPFCDCHAKLREQVQTDGCCACRKWEAERQEVWQRYFVTGQAN